MFTFVVVVDVAILLFLFKSLFNQFIMVSMANSVTYAVLYTREFNGAV